MDELTQYLKNTIIYTESELELILNKKIIITKNHINNIRIKFCCEYNFNIIEIFEKYGYVFTNDDYIMLVNKYRYAIRFIQKDKQTIEICKIAVQQCGDILYFISEDKKTNEIYEIAVRTNGQSLLFVPNNKKTIEICKIAVQQDGLTLLYIQEDKKTVEICKIAVQQNKQALLYVPNNKKYLFIKK